MNGIQREHSYGIIPFYRRSLADYIFFVGHSLPRDGKEGFWKFPKGHKNYEEENDIEVALRELREEVGFSIPREGVIESVSFEEEYFYERSKESPRGDEGIVRKINTYWLGQAVSRGSNAPEVELDKKEFLEYLWATFDEANSLVPENSQKFLKDAHDFLVRNRV
jgi:8-oxo-dGTP pyrophosphatase MutT (NUDIX family)